MSTERLEKFYSRLRLEEADVLLQFGWGTGDSGEVLRQRIRADARVIVFEPNEELFRLSAAQPGVDTVLQDRRFQFVTGLQVPRFFEDWGLGPYLETDKFLWIESPAALRENGPLAESMRVQFKTHLRDRAANLLTHFRNGEQYFRNVIANFEYQRDSDAGRLFGCFTNKPTVIVSAGPSLDRNIHELRGFENRCFILSVDTALRPLLAAGITPHAVIIADSSELNAQHIAGIVPESTYLIAEQSVHPNAMQSSTKRFLFGLGLFPDSLFAKFGFGKSTLESWGSVATTALDLACRIGANPIIFTGQDFAYSWNRDYASNTIYDGNHFDIRESGKVRTVDVFGDEAFTTENLIAYRDFFVRRMKRAAGIRFINATEGGILTEGAEILPLREALAQSATETVEASRILRDRFRPTKISTEPLGHLMKVLQSRRTDCNCLNEFLELTAKEHLLANNEDEIGNAIQRGCEWMQR